MNSGPRPTDRRVLVVDDDADTREMLTILLELNGWRVLTAPSGEAALELLQDQDVAAVVLDNRMPGMSGIEVAARLLDAGHPARLVFVTGAEEAGEEARKLGLSHCLRKPIDAPRLLDILNGDS